MEPHPDGSITIDNTQYIILPSDESGWTDDIIEQAYQKLATMSFEDFHDLLKPGLRALSTTREELGKYTMREVSRSMAVARLTRLKLPLCAASSPSSLPADPHVQSRAGSTRS
jgi:hypothetical protein